MAKNEEKAKVGRPKLAEPELIKESWVSIGACFVVALVMVLCGSFAFAGTNAIEFLSIVGENKLQGNVVSANVPRVPAKNVTVIPAKKATVIPAKKTTKKIIKPNGEVSYIIPANQTKVIRMD